MRSFSNVEQQNQRRGDRAENRSLSFALFGARDSATSVISTATFALHHHRGTATSSDTPTVRHFAATGSEASLAFPCVCAASIFPSQNQKTTRRRSSLVSCQDGWRGSQHEEVVAPSPDKESGEGMDRRAESCKPLLLHTRQRPDHMLTMTIPHISSLRRRSSTNSARRKKRNGICRSSSGSRRSRRGRSGPRRWNGCTRPRLLVARRIRMIWRITCLARSALIKCLRAMTTPRYVDPSTQLGPNLC